MVRRYGLPCAAIVLAKHMAWMRYTKKAPARRLQRAQDTHFDLAGYSDHIHIKLDFLAIDNPASSLSLHHLGVSGESL